MKLADNWRIIYDDGVILQFHEERTRNKKEGGTEQYEYTDNHYVPDIKTAFQVFLREYTKGSESVEAALKRINEVEQFIKNFKCK